LHSNLLTFAEEFKDLTNQLPLGKLGAADTRDDCVLDFLKLPQELYYAELFDGECD